MPRKALACPECGADHDSGWREEAASIDADGGSDFDYEEYVAREFGSPGGHTGMHPLWWITALVLLLILVFFFLRSL